MSTAIVRAHSKLGRTLLFILFGCLGRLGWINHVLLVLVISLAVQWSVCHGWQGNGEVQSLKGGLCKDDFNLRLIHDANHAC